LVGLNQWGYRSLAGILLRNWALRDAELAPRIAFELPDFDAAADPRDTARRLAASRPDLAGFSCFVWNIGRILEVVREFKAVSPGTRVILGGPEAAATAERLLETHAAVDFVAAGEGEETFLALLRCLALGDRALSAVPGLVYREGGVVRRTLDAPLIPLDATPPVYAEGGGEPSPVQSLLETSRGCPFLCSFCDWGPRKMRYVPLERIERELKSLVPRSGYIFLCDADILMDRARGAAIMEAFSRAAEGVECTLHFETNPIFLTEQVVDIVARAPRKFHLSFGLQSVNPRAHEAVRRTLDLRRVEANVDLLRRKAPDANYSFSLIYGLPGDDLEGFRETLDWALRRHAGHFCAGQLMMIPGADVNRQAAEFSIRHQAEPPYQATETATMSRADMTRARELSVFVGLLLQFKPLLELVFPRDGSETSARPRGAAVARLERWIARLREQHVDLTSGLPVADFDGYRPDERIRMAGERLRADPLTLAAAAYATRRFADDERAAAAGLAA
jgi:anaerobic magnesium-protoporphyrin IX monomethyl ester cyclase